MERFQSVVSQLFQQASAVTRWAALFAVAFILDGVSIQRVLLMLCLCAENCAPGWCCG
jgi:hypothetical protein